MAGLHASIRLLSRVTTHQYMDLSARHHVWLADENSNQLLSRATYFVAYPV